MNRKIITLLAVLLFAVNIVNAIVPEPCLLFSFTSKNIARLGVVNTSGGNLNLNIINTTGKSFFSETVKKGTNYFKLIDLSALPDGNYTVELNGDNENLIKEFNKTGNYLSTGKLIKETAPNFQRVDNKTFGFVFKNVRNSAVSVEIEHNNGIVFEEHNLTGLIIMKKYSLEKFPKDTYTVKVHAGDRVYSYKLTVM